MNIIEKSIKEIKPYKKNAKKHDKTQIDNVAESIRQFGFIQPVVVDKDGIIVIGHCRYEAAKQLKMDSVPCVLVDELTDEQINALRIVDNKTNESSWDLDLLADELAEIDLSGFDFDFEINGKEEEQKIIEDEPPEIDEQQEPTCKLLDIWQLGEHRLICGDSTDRATIDRLMDGAKADMVFTDPPYNVDYASKNEFLNEADKGNHIQEDIKNDYGMTDDEIGEKIWRPAFQNLRDSAKDDCSIYCTMPQGGAHMMMMIMMMCSASWQVKHELIWVKNNHVLGRTDYYYKHEPILFGWAKTHKFYGKGEFDKSVWEIPKPQKSDLHPTMKPIRLIVNAILNSSKEGDVIIDFFGGSGSTMIACEQLGRKCYMCEISPKYCDVIIQRWENFTGKKAVKLN